MMNLNLSFDLKSAVVPHQDYLAYRHVVSCDSLLFLILAALLHQQQYHACGCGKT
jgi:hypothetical protein